MGQDRDDRLAELERENAMLKAAIRACPAGILISTAPDGVIEHWNPAAIGIRGAKEEELTQIPLEKHPSRWQTFDADGKPFDPEELPLARALLRGEVVHGADVIIRGADGKDRWVAGHAAPVKDGEGNIVAAVVVFPDITARKQAELERERFRAMAEVSPDFIGIADAEWRSLYLNPAACALCGVEMADLATVDITRFHPPAIGEETLRNRLRIATEEGSWSGETELLLADGTAMPGWQTLTAHRGADGKVSYFSTIIRDLRQERSLEQQLSQSQRLESVGRLAGGIAHDFNNLLTVIQNNAEMVRNELQPWDEGRDDLEQVILASERAADLCRQLLSFARRQIIEPKTLELHAVVEQLTRLLRRTLGEDILLHTDVPKDVWPIRADPSQFDQILVNLVVNARDAMPDGGQLTIEAENVELDEAYCALHPEVSPGSYVMVAVSDTGCGMSPEVRASAFEPFFSTKGPHHGSGLGLATVHGAVRQNKGHIYLYSELGKGSTFKIYWPRTEAATAAASAERVRRADGRGSLLVVEDEEIVRNLTVRLLRRAGFDVLSAADGPAALELSDAHEGPIDALVTDVVMPHMNGRDLAELLRQRRPNVQVLFVSGYTENSIVHHGVIEDGVSFLSKPFAAAALVDSVNRLLGDG